MSKKNKASAQNVNTNEKKKKRFSFSDLVYNDKYLILLSIFLAVVVWVGSSLSVGSDDTKTIKVNAPIKLSSKLSSQLGMQYYSLQNSVDISVTLSGPKYVIGQVTEDDLNIVFDTSAVNRTGNQSIPIRVTNKSKRLDFTVDSVYPSAIDGFFDVNTTKTFDVDLIYDEDNVADGYIFGEPIISEDKIAVSGPKTYVDKIERAYCEVDFDNKKNLTEPYTTECAIQIDGPGVESSYLTVTNRTDTNTPIKSLSVTLPVLKTTVLPITSTFEDRPTSLANNIVKVTYSTNRIYAGVLSTADISAADIGTIYFGDLKVGTQEFDFDVSTLNGISVLDDTKKITARVTVSNKYSAHKVRVNSSNIVVEGVPDGKKATVEGLDATTVTVIAPKNSKINSSNLTMKCDVSKQNEDNVYPVTITVSDGKSWAYGKYNATVTIK